MSVADDIINGTYGKKKKSIADDIINGTYKTESIFKNTGSRTILNTSPNTVSKTTNRYDKSDSWFKSGAFSDGYQFGDITKTAAATVSDVGKGVAKGVATLGEGIGDLAQYGVAGISDALGNEEYADKLRKKAQVNSVDKLFETNNILNQSIKKNTLLGEKSDNVTEGLGYVAGVLATGGAAGALGAGALGATAATTGLTFTSSMGGGMSQAYQGRASDEEAVKYGLMSGIAEAGTELMFGGLGKSIKAIGLSTGLSSADDMLAQKISGIFKNQLAKNITSTAVKSGAEGLEEVASGILQAVGQKMTYMKEEDFTKLVKDQDLLEQFITGAVVSGIAQTPSTMKYSKNGRDIITGYTQNEQSIFDSEFDSRVTESQKKQALNTEIEKAIIEKEKTFGELTTDQKNKIKNDVRTKVDNGEIEFTELGKKDIEKIRKEVKADLEKGYIGTDVIENTLSSDKTAQIKELESKLNNVKDSTEKQQIEAKLNELKVSRAEELRSKLKNDTLLQESYNQENLKKESFEYKPQETDTEITKELAESAKNAKMNNTRKMHELFDWVNKVSNDKNTNYGFVNNKQLEEIGHYDKLEQGKSINGLVTVDKDGKTKVLINVDSDKAINTIIGHETTHLLEGTNEYKLLQDVVKEYATTKGEYDAKYKAIESLYNGTKADVDNEVTADLVGDYLFTDEQFVQSLSVKQPNVFQKVYDYIKHAVKLATAGSKEARQLEQLKYRFDQAYKQNVKSIEADTKLSLNANKSEIKLPDKEIEDYTYKDIDSINEQIINNFDEEISKSANDLLREHSNDLYIKYDDIDKEIENILNGNLNDYLTSNFSEELNDTITSELNNRISEALSEKIKAEGYNYDDSGLSMNSNINDGYNEMIDFLDNNNIDYEISKSTNAGIVPSVYIKDSEGETIARVGNHYNSNMNGSELIFDNKDYTNWKESIIKKIAKKNTLFEQYLDENNIRYSLSDNQGRELTKEQQEYFKNVDEKLKDENSNLKVMYHGTPNDFTQFNYDFIGSNGTALGKGFYLTDDRKMAESYTGENGKVMELYANIQNPISLYDKTITKSEFKKYITELSKQDDYFLWDYADLNSESVNSAIDKVVKLNYDYSNNDVDLINGILNTASVGWEKGFRLLKDTLGYDGVVRINNEFNVYIPFLPEQIKSVDNLNPTDNPDIRKSLSAKNEEIAPTGKYNVYGKDIKLQEDKAPQNIVENEQVLSKDKTKSSSNKASAIFNGEKEQDTAPISQDIVEQQKQESFKALTDKDISPTAENTVPEVETNAKVESPLDTRDIDEVGNRKVKAYQYENPEVRPYFQVEAQNMIYDIDNTIKGEKGLIQDELGNTEYYGTTRQTTEAIAYLKDNYGYSYDQIRKGLNAIIEDNGLENNAVSKRIEFMLDERLRDGYTTSDGVQIPANQEYINFLQDKQVTQYNEEAYNEWQKSLDGLEAPLESNTEAPNNAIQPQTIDTEQTAPIKNNIAQNVNTEQIETKQRSWAKTATESEVVKGKLNIGDLDTNSITYEVKSNKKTLSTANAKLDQFGYDESLKYFNSKLMDEKVTTEDIVLGERLIQEALKKGDNKTATELIENVYILGTELGQKIQVLSIIQKLTPEGQLRVLQKVVNRGKVKGDKAFDNVKITQEMADKILNTKKEDGSFDQKELNQAVEEVKQDIANQMSVTLGEKIDAWRYLSMLGNPKSHIRNVISSIAMKGTLSVKNAMARTIEDIAPIKNKTKTWKRASDTVSKFADQTTIEMKDIIMGENKYSEDTSIKSKRKIFKNKILEGIYNFNSDLLGKEDFMFSKLAFKNSFKEYLTANNIKTDSDIKNNPKVIEKAKLYATEQAEIATFRKYSYLANKISELEHKNIAGKVVVGSVMPFKRTPINIAKAGLEYSPLGFTKTLTADAIAVKNGTMEASQLIDNISKNTVGTALTLIGYMLASSGFIQGGGDDDKESKYDSQLGEMTYSLKIGDKSYSLSWLSPVAMPLFVGANAFSQLEEGKEWDSDVVIQTLAQTLDPLSEMSFLSGLNNVLSSYDTGMEKFAGIGKSVIQGYTGQFIPTISSQVAATLDDTKRSTTATKEGGNQFIDQTINKLKYKIPLLRETLEPSLDIWGNEVKQAEDMGQRAIDNFVAPYSTKKDITTSVDKELKEIYRETGENSVLPSTSSNYLNYEDKRYDMTAKEYTEFKKNTGQTAYDLLEELFTTNTYAESNSTEKAKLISNVYEYAKDVSKKEYFDKKGVTYTNTTKDNIPVYKEKSVKSAIENDMSVDEYNYYQQNPAKYATISSITDYDTYKTYSKDIEALKGDKDSNNKTIANSRKNKVYDYINNLDLGYEQKLILAKMNYPSDDRYNYEIIDYLNNSSNIDYSTMESILLELGFEVSTDGTINW